MLKIDLKGKRAFVAGIGDDRGYGWAIAKALAEAGAEILVGTWTPMMKIFLGGLEAGKFDAAREMSDGRLLTFTKIYALDATFDHMDDVPEEIRENKRYKTAGAYSVSDVAAAVQQEFGTIDILVHSLANGPEVKNSLLDTSRQGYLAALSASSYSLVSLLRHFGPLMPRGSAVLTLSYLAAERAVPGYGGGMSSAKAALESDIRTLAWEAGQRWGVRVNAISAGALGSRAAKAIGFMDKMIAYQQANAPLNKDLDADEVAYPAAFLLSPLGSGITGETLHVDNGLHAMGVAVDSAALQGLHTQATNACVD